MASQAAKKVKKNNARLPRTAGLRTITQLSAELTKAGLDPSRIEERAKMLAKVAGAKRKRSSEDGDGDVEMGDAAREDDASWVDMDVDGEEGAPAKRVKGNLGAVIAVDTKRHPKSNRQLAGLRDMEVTLP